MCPVTEETFKHFPRGSVYSELFKHELSVLGKFHPEAGASESSSLFV